MPAALKPVMVVVGLDGIVIVATLGFDVRAVHMPMPVPAIVATPPGRRIQETF